MLSTVNEPWQAILSFGLAIGIGMAAHDIVTLSTIARWFNTKRGRMTGVGKVGTACGQIAVPLAAALLIGEYGWRQSFFFMGIIALILLLLAAWLIGDKPPAPKQLDTTAPSIQRNFFRPVVTFEIAMVKLVME